MSKQTVLDRLVQALSATDRALTSAYAWPRES